MRFLSNTFTGICFALFCAHLLRRAVELSLKNIDRSDVNFSLAHLLGTLQRSDWSSKILQRLNAANDLYDLYVSAYYTKDRNYTWTAGKTSGNLGRKRERSRRVADNRCVQSWKLYASVLPATAHIIVFWLIDWLIDRFIVKHAYSRIVLRRVSSYQLNAKVQSDNRFFLFISLSQS